MKNPLSKLIADYGMILALAALCVFFSIVTYTEQSPEGEFGADAVTLLIREHPTKNPRVFIAGAERLDDTAFVSKLEANLKRSGANLVGVVRGEPKIVRDNLVRLSNEGTKIDIIACTRTAGAWLLFEDVKSDFPALGTPSIIKAKSYRWPNFLKAENLLNIANQIAVIAIVAIGMTIVIVTGGIDLSVGSLIALSAVVSSKLIRDFAGGLEASGIAMTFCCLAAILLSGVCGLFSGAMVTRFRIPPFIVTLAVMLVSSGSAYILSKGQSIYQIPESFVWLGRGSDLFNLPNAVVLMLALYAAAHVLMSRMKLGRYLYAVGGNSESARLSGVSVNRVLLFAYLASGLLAGLGGVIMASQLKSGSATYGNMYELYVIAAVVVGGTSLSGGEGKMLGTLTGAFTIAVIQNGMNLTNVESYTQKVVLGLVILAAVLLDKIRHSR